MKSIYLLIFTLILACNNPKKDNNYFLAITKKEIQDTKKLNYPIEQTIIDTTSSLSNCLNKYIPNIDSKFRTIEKKLIEDQILENTSPNAYRKLFLIHIKTMNLNGFENTPLYFDQRNAIIEHTKKLELIKNVLRNPPKCIQEILLGSKFKNSSITKFMQRENEFDQLMVLGEAADEWELLNSLEEIVYYHFKITYFESKDVKDLILLRLYIQNQN
ncbi:hypothetical protein I2486_19915 [Cellulophaga sp. E16_2]|uniref:hypothetical protein n=1 Tax=Cellulophaga sp. E16_2 TaxID=2789297 RepID=UPI001A92689C|nr:hypothetical protein [Cellulophaga sp. E16_2]MBO0593672.1 hypothetical protein [Cellulophaga sp. E16_2]